MRDDTSNLLTPSADETRLRANAKNDTLLADMADAALRFWDARWFLFKAGVVGTATAVAIALLLPLTFESTTRLMPPDKRSSSGLAMIAGAISERMGNIGPDGIGVQSPGAVFLQVLRSRTMQDRLIDRFNLRKIYNASLYAQARTRLGNDTEFGEDRKSGVITISVKAKSPQLAAGLAKAYVEELNSMMARLDTSAAHRERVFLEQQLKSVKERLDADSALLSEFSSKNTTIDLQEQAKATVTAAAALRGQTVIAESELAGLRQTYGPENARVRAAEAKVAALRRQLEDVRGGSLPGNDADGYPSIRKLPLLGVKYYDLYRNVKVQESVFEILTKQYEMAKTQEARDIPSIRVLDEADVPERKSGPMRTVIVLSGGVLSLAFGCAFIVLQDWWLAQAADSPARVRLSRVTAGLRGDASRLPLVRKWIRKPVPRRA